MQFVVLGAGPGGLSAAAEALRLGHAVTIFDPEGLGGNALRHSLVPSKVWIRAVDALATVSGFTVEGRRADWVRLKASQHRLVEGGIRRAEVAIRGATVIPEAGQFVAPRTIVGMQSGRRVEADVVIVAVGSRQRLIPGMNPDGKRVWVPRIFQALDALPKSLAIVGAGATGLEAASLFSRLGVAVHLYAPTRRLLPHLSGELGKRLQARLESAGMQFYGERRVTRLQPEGDRAVRLVWQSGQQVGEDVRSPVFLATGRAPLFERRRLEELGFALDDAGFFRVDASLKTTVSRVYAVGDAAGEPLFANKAWHQGRLAVRHAVGEDTSVGSPSPWVHAIYTRPEVAWVGVSSSLRIAGEVDAPWLYDTLLGEDVPPYLVLYRNADDRIVGGEALGSGAAEIMSVVALAIQRGLRPIDLNAFQPASPTYAEALVALVQQRFSGGL